MLPKIIIFNSVSIDNAIKDFEIDLMLHYEVLGNFLADALLIGSNTAKTGIELFLKNIPKEKRSDFKKPKLSPEDKRMLWIIPDTKGTMKGLLHVHRKSGYAKDIIVLVSKRTPSDYIDYLTKRNYDFLVVGNDQVDYEQAMREMNRLYGIKTIVTDSGGVLASILLENKLVDEIQLLVSPQIIGKQAINLFRTLNQTIKLKLNKIAKVGEEHVLLTYKVKK